MNQKRFLPSRRVLCFILLLIILGCGLTMVIIGPEGYFSPYPAIDTHFAPGYSEQAFQDIQAGMTKAEVLQRLGPPLNRTSDPSWTYSRDGALGVWDFAWLVRAVNFDENGIVKEKVALVAYD
jgi:hypothetical protein